MFWHSCASSPSTTTAIGSRPIKTDMMPCAPLGSRTWNGSSVWSPTMTPKRVASLSRTLFTASIVISAILEQLRGLIDAESDEFLAIINDPAITSRYQWMSRSLKTIPKGYPKDHPLAQYLKMKEYLLVKHVDDEYFDCDDWVERVASDLQPLKPLHDFLNYVFE